jgi:putative endonuclease
MDRKDDNNRAVGTIGEEIAVEYLKKNNYEILEKNFRYKRLGEIDIISREKNYVCFVEVKTRSSVQFGYPREAVNRKKQDNIRKLAQIYLAQRNIKNADIRFDVVEVYIEKGVNDIQVKKVSLIRNAF